MFDDDLKRVRTLVRDCPAQAAAIAAAASL
jgi:hypothetical protein